MLEIEKYPCENFNEARARERYWYEILNSKLNSMKPYVYCEEKKMIAKERDHIFYQINKKK